MGYEITVTKTEFKRWFNIWNWHRCLVITFLGLGLIDDEETEHHLMMVNNLQHSEQSDLDPESEDLAAALQRFDDETRYQIHHAPTSKEDVKIIQTEYDFDDEGRIIGGRGMMPVSAAGIVDEQFEKALFSMLKMQTKTNHLLIDHREELNLDIETCHQLHSMNGEEFSSDIEMVLAVGAMIGLQRCMSDCSLDVWAALEEITNGKVNEDDGHPGGLTLKARINDAVKHEPSFELDELWAEMGAIGSFCGVMAEAGLHNSTIKIT